ncbi:MAG: DUF1311 domain-containing protein [Zetaproteobacteria bacterium]|nr:DUF1311 domain-containing protein [Zetaproteobacteria bacterium]
MRFVGLLIVSLCSFVAHAQNFNDKLLSDDYNRCVQASEQKAGLLLLCIQREYGVQKEAMQDGYDEAMVRISEKKQQRLLEEQPLWDLGINASCQPYAQVGGGAYAEFRSIYCFTHAYAERAKQLTKMR